MSQHKPLCRLFASEGRCRFGDKCKFSHVRGTATAPGSPSRAPRTAPPSSGSPAGGRAPPGAPRQVCNFFWESGSCARGFECQFRHECKRTNQAGTSSDTLEGQIRPQEPPDFFSPEGMALNNGSVQDERHSLNPSEAHNHMKAFLRDNYRFENAAKVQGFVRILGSVDKRNNTWTIETAQSFLDMIVNGNVLLRISEVLCFEPVSFKIGNGSNTLSFQRGYFPVLQFFASDLILKSTLHKNIHHLYTALENNYDKVHAAIQECVGNMIQSGSWKDPTSHLTPMLQNNLDGVTVFRTLSTVLFQFFNRFKDAIRNHPDLSVLVDDLASWFDQWADKVTANPPQFADTVVDSQVRRMTIAQLREDIERLKTIVNRESNTVTRLHRAPPKPTLTPEEKRRALIGRLEQTYDPPGSLRREGPRHDNDSENISNIRIAPTRAELLCPVNSYLPIFLPDAPHHLPEHSIERHIDIQFRLLREELVKPIRASLSVLYDDLTVMWDQSKKKREPTKLEELLKKKGGAYRTSGHDSVFFQVYTNIAYSPLKAERRQLTVGLEMDAPSGPASDSNAKKRYEYWEHSKKLQSGSLVALVLISQRTVRMYLGVTTSFGKDIAESSKASKDRIQVRVSFFDAEVELMALRCEKITSDQQTYSLLVDNSVMYESIRPFLERMQTLEPTEIPFSRYVAQSGPLDGVAIHLPRYSTVPGFRFKLQCLAKEGRRIHDLDVMRPEHVPRARLELRDNSILDPSQVDAVIDTLTREVSLIQGPPGTGKSFTAKEILRVLFASRIKPIVLIAYTNHALDHMLTSILDAGITSKLVRVGTRTSDERIAEYTLDKLEREAGASSLDRNIKRQYAIMKKLEEDMLKVMNSIQLPAVSWHKIQQYLEIHSPEHAERIETPPYWIQQLTERIWADEEENGEWIDANKSKKFNPSLSHTFYGFWKDGDDIKFITPPPQVQPPRKRGAKAVEVPTGPHPDVAKFFVDLGFGSMMPPIPTTNRPTDVLLGNSTVWSMSLNERQRLAAEWEERIRSMAYESHLSHYQELRQNYKEACKEYNDIRDEVRHRLLRETDLIGCTTTGAAKLTSLLNIISPRVLLVEEAGQVLEAHILTSLVPSVHHLICIGDPQQLRPNLANYGLSMDSDRGKLLYKFDRSLMERLADEGLPMSQINVQRRMRPEISHFIRSILYPKLIDNDVVNDYPAVQGMRSNVYFLNHINKEGGTDDSVSKVNMFEVEMIRDLVLYFLKQGSYSGPGDIAVLCAYLGQLQKVRAALRDLKIAVSIDERDAQELVRTGLEESSEFEEVLVAKHIRLGTVDIFQGQEAKIVIVSLVRNTGTYETDSASIGFLKSSNRINVALSRAKHGLYILGNAANLRKNETWSVILDEMEARNQIGTGIPIICTRHPEQQRLISKAGELSRLCPGGGCLLPCGTQLPCGHICPSSCHLDLDNHRSMRCYMPCNRITCPRQHPCSRECSENCGKCEFPMYNVRLPCGHVEKKVPCHMLETLQEVKCQKQVQRRLPTCEHSASMRCFQDPSEKQCKEPCNGIMDCCSRTCKSPCNQCQNLTIASGGNEATKQIPRTKHTTHPCERTLYCQHLCGLACARDHACNSTCKERCRQQCSHHHCTKPCSEPCAPCMEPCVWACAHHECPVLCGSICSRLPCDEPCTNMLPCGHPCPSVCGEPCAVQKCVTCMPPDKRTDIVDFIMQRRLEEIDLTSTDVSDQLITLACGHVYTVETLDGHCGMADYYEIDAMGCFLSTKAPPTSYQSPPSCPLCKGPITALRYGRVTKRATLDILEQNVASSMSRSLENLSPDMEKLSSDLSASEESAKKMKSDIATDAQALENVRTPVAIPDGDGPLPDSLLDKSGMHNKHGLTPEEARTWFAIVGGLLKVYRKVVRVATTGGAHVKAYQAALATLFRLEMEAIANDPTRASDSPEPEAMIAVNQKIGQPPHKADTRFQIEAFFLSLEIRFMLAQIAFSRVEGLPMTSEDPNVTRHRELWCDFVRFIHKSCIADSLKALLMAKKSSASRQAARSAVYGIRSEFEQFRFDVMIARAELFRTARLVPLERIKLARVVDAKKSSMKSDLERFKGEYVRSRPSRDTKELVEERKWFDDNCGLKTQRWFEDCDELRKYVLNDKVYQPISLQERQDIVKAFGFSHRGHFYNCENGHTFVITECGGAMEAARCPECNAPIGGGNHTLNSSNTRATEFEEIAGNQGALNGHWPWARGA